MGERMIYVPYDEFVKAVERSERLECIVNMIKNGNSYASDEIYAVLGLKKDKDA